MSASYKSRLLEFEDTLAADVIDIKQLKELCFQGIPDKEGIRSLCWKLLLDYLPVVKSTRTEFLCEKRGVYKQFIRDFIVNPDKERSTGEGNCSAGGDHPLNPNPDSQWSTYFKENEVLTQIDKDVRRLCPDIAFFQTATRFPCREVQKPDGESDVPTLRKRVESQMLKVSDVKKNLRGIPELISTRKKAAEEYAVLDCGQEAHWEVVERVLFVYAKLNPGQGYVQGMNEIIGPIYFVFASDPDDAWAEHAEADTFFCFTNMMSEIRDHFIKTLDESASGINSLMQQLQERIKRQDLEVYLRLEQQELRPQFYSFRWLTLLLSQEFDLPDVIRIWDSLIADERRFTFLIEICLAMVLTMRKELLEGDFPHNVKLLQNFPSCDIHVLLALAVDCRNKPC